jgi:hypothetical protein
LGVVAACRDSSSEWCWHRAADAQAHRRMCRLPAASPCPLPPPRPLPDPPCDACSATMRDELPDGSHPDVLTLLLRHRNTVAGVFSGHYHRRASEWALHATARMLHPATHMPQRPWAQRMAEPRGVGQLSSMRTVGGHQLRVATAASAAAAGAWTGAAHTPSRTSRCRRCATTPTTGSCSACRSAGPYGAARAV